MRLRKRLCLKGIRNHRAGLFGGNLGSVCATNVPQFAGQSQLFKCATASWIKPALVDEPEWHYDTNMNGQTGSEFAECSSPLMPCHAGATGDTVKTAKMSLTNSDSFRVQLRYDPVAAFDLIPQLFTLVVDCLTLGTDSFEDAVGN